MCSWRLTVEIDGVGWRQEFGLGVCGRNLR